MSGLERQEVRSYDSYRDLYDAQVALGWSDGLPMVPATPERVEAFLAASGLQPDEVIGEVATRGVVCTAEQVAANAVLAGCRPGYMPVVVAAVRAHLSPLGNCHSTTATLGGAAQVVIVNGPVRQRLGIVGGAGCFGPGHRANATIGRALRLVIRNVCRALPGTVDRAAFSQPGRYSFCFGEDEEGSSWDPLHVTRGFDRTADVVTVHSITDFTAHCDDASGTPEQLLGAIARMGRVRPIERDDFVGTARTVVVVIGPEHREALVGAGWNKARVSEFLFQAFTEPPSRTDDDRWGNHPAGGATESTFAIPVPENVLVVGAGGPGMQLSWIFYPHLATSVSISI